MLKERSGVTRDLKVRKEGQRESRVPREERMTEKGERANLLESIPAILRRKRQVPRGESQEDFLGQSRAQCHSLQVRQGVGGLDGAGFGRGVEDGFGAEG